MRFPVLHRPSRLSEEGQIFICHTLTAIQPLDLTSRCGDEGIDEWGPLARARARPPAHPSFVPLSDASAAGWSEFPGRENRPPGPRRTRRGMPCLGCFVVVPVEVIP
jgi:hypothetical protein